MRFSKEACSLDQFAERIFKINICVAIHSYQGEQSHERKKKELLAWDQKGPISTFRA